MSNDTSHSPAKAKPARRAAWLAWRLLRLPVLSYLIVMLAMTFLETWLVYPVPPRQRSNWDPPGLSREDVWLQAADGTRLFAWFAPHPDPKMAVVYCHGNGEHVADNAELVDLLRHRLQASVLIFDYRGYGFSEGRPHEAGLIADGLAAQRWLAERTGVSPADVVVMGRSIGGGVAVAMAAQQGARALVLVNTFTRLTDTAAELYPWLPVRLLMRNRFDSVTRIVDYDGPVLQSHGTEDRIIPIEMGQRLFKAAPTSKKQFLEHRGRGHNDPPPHRFYDHLASFIDDHSD